MTRLIAIFIIAIAIAGCSTAPHIDRLAQIEQQAISDYRSGKLTTKEYYRVMISIGKERQKFAAQRAAANRAYARDVANNMQKYSRQQTELFKASQLQPNTLRPMPMGTSCATNVYGHTAYTNCY